MTTHSDEITAAKDRVVEAAREWRFSNGISTCEALRSALVALESLAQPMTAMEVVERVRCWLHDGSDDRTTTAMCNDLEREIRERQEGKA